MLWNSRLQPIMLFKLPILCYEAMLQIFAYYAPIMLLKTYLSCRISSTVSDLCLGIHYSILMIDSKVFVMEFRLFY